MTSKDIPETRTVLLPGGSGTLFDYYRRAIAGRGTVEHCERAIFRDG
jgi:hypothetical protein